MGFRKLSFESATGARLAARLDSPDDRQPLAYALFAHCFTCSKNLKAIANISRALARQGIAVLRFDFTGLGESEGEFANTNFSSNVADLIAAADFLSTEFEAPRILVGHSLGGSAVLQAAVHVPSCVAVVTIAAPGEVTHLVHLLGDAAEAIEAEGESEIRIAGQTFKIKKQLLDDLERTRMQETIRNLGKALLIFHSPQDQIVGIDNATQIFQAARHPKSFVSLAGADHLLSEPGDSRYVGSLIATWAGRYLEIARPDRG